MTAIREISGMDKETERESRMTINLSAYMFSGSEFRAMQFGVLLCFWFDESVRV